jgi:hypothetical protein
MVSPIRGEPPLGQLYVTVADGVVRFELVLERNHDRHPRSDGQNLQLS